MQYASVRIHENVATIKIDRPATCNALSPAVISDLRQAFSDVHQEKRAAAVVLTGSGEHFCSGIDLSVLSETALSPPAEAMGDWLAIWRQLTELYEDMLRLPKPIIAAVDGCALGAGFGLALAADMIVATERSEFAANAIRLGLVGGATSALLEFRLGGSIASRLILLGERVSAIQANHWGLLADLVVPGQIWVAANELAKRCGLAPREATQANKRVLNESIGEQLLTLLAATTNHSATACSTDSAAEGILAFLEKRPPSWQD